MPLFYLDFIVCGYLPHSRDACQVINCLLQVLDIKDKVWCVLVNLEWSHMGPYMSLFLFILRIGDVEQTLAIHTGASVYVLQFSHISAWLLLCCCQKFVCLEYAGKASMQVFMYCSYLFAMDWQFWCPGKWRCSFYIKHYRLYKLWLIQQSGCCK